MFKKMTKMDRLTRILETLQDSYMFTPTGECPEGEVLLDGDAVAKARSEIVELFKRYT